MINNYTSWCTIIKKNKKFASRLFIQKGTNQEHEEGGLYEINSYSQEKPTTGIESRKENWSKKKGAAGRGWQALKKMKIKILRLLLEYQ